MKKKIKEEFVQLFLPNAPKTHLENMYISN
jgi:hypothetical protein